MHVARYIGATRPYHGKWVTQVDRDGEAAVSTAELEWSMLEQQLEALERAPSWGWLRVLPWLLVIAGLAIIVGLGVHGYGAYSTVTRINVNARIDTPNPLVLFQETATLGVRIGSTVETSQRGNYTRALEQYVLDATGAAFGLVLVLGGLLVRLNQ
jgi:hypothetical protein